MELTEKQKAIVQEAVERPNAPDSIVAEETEATRSYVNRVRDDNSEVIDEMADLTDISGVTGEQAFNLWTTGYQTRFDLRVAEQSELAEVEGIGNALAARIKADVGGEPEHTTVEDELTDLEEELEDTEPLPEFDDLIDDVDVDESESVDLEEQYPEAEELDPDDHKATYTHSTDSSTSSSYTIEDSSESKTTENKGIIARFLGWLF